MLVSEGMMCHWLVRDGHLLKLTFSHDELNDAGELLMLETFAFFPGASFWCGCFMVEQGWRANLSLSTLTGFCVLFDAENKGFGLRAVSGAHGKSASGVVRDACRH